jgi:DNA helicase II / ATP-dependent DNA helicase PcrA
MVRFKMVDALLPSSIAKRLVMYNANTIDFAHQQNIVFELLQDLHFRQKIKENIKFIMVDEYQDTSYIQEQILLRLAEPTNNL